MLRCKGIEDMENHESVIFQLISTDDIDELGISATNRERVGKSPVYLKYCAN